MIWRRFIGFALSRRMTEAGCCPPAPQYAGVQGDHNAAYVEFQLPAELQQGYRCRVEYVDGAAEWSDRGADAVGGMCGVPLPRA